MAIQVSCDESNGPECIPSFAIGIQRTTNPAVEYPGRLMGHSLEIDNIIATTAMEGVTLDESVIDDLGKVERRERSADEIVDDRISRLRSRISRV